MPAPFKPDTELDPEAYRGPAGPAGPPGEPGPPGRDGEPGPPGRDGEPGAKGDTGPAGKDGAAGTTGPRGPQGAVGPGITWRGELDEKKNYAVNDVVEYGGTSYVVQQPVSGAMKPGESNGWEAYYDLLASRGDRGAGGPPGAQGIKGEKGDKGDRGDRGPEGATGVPGTYTDWLAQGNDGPYSEFLALITGAAGEKGETGARGPSGFPGTYEDWLEHGNSGTYADFLAAIKGAKGDKGETGAQGYQGIQGPQGPQGQIGPAGTPGTYQDWLAQGNSGSYAQFLAVIRGPKGDTGVQGTAGVDGLPGTYAEWLEQGGSGSYEDFLELTRGPQGIGGPQGPQGPQGERGPTGDRGAAGGPGPKGDQGIPGPVGMTWLGPWEPDVDYYATNVVGYNGRAYIAVTNAPATGQTPGASGDWEVLAERGEQGPQGVKGEKGDVGPLGPVGFTFRGEYDPLIAYKERDAVIHNGALWIATHDLTSFDYPPAADSTGNADWGRLLPRGLKGDKGDPGAKGDQGIQGVQGPQGIQGPQGLKGDKGDPGIQGPAGTSGHTIRDEGTAQATRTSLDFVGAGVTVTDDQANDKTVVTIPGGGGGAGGPSGQTIALENAASRVITIDPSVGSYQFVLHGVINQNGAQRSVTLRPGGVVLGQTLYDGKYVLGGAAPASDTLRRTNQGWFVGISWGTPAGINGGTPILASGQLSARPVGGRAFYNGHFNIADPTSSTTIATYEANSIVETAADYNSVTLDFGGGTFTGIVQLIPAGGSGGAVPTSDIWVDDFSTDRRGEYEGGADQCTLANGQLTSTAQRDLTPKIITRLPSCFVVQAKFVNGAAGNDISFGLRTLAGGVSYFIQAIRQADTNLVLFSWYNGVYTALASTGLQGAAHAAGQTRWLRLIFTGRRVTVLYYVNDPVNPGVAAAQSISDFLLPAEYVAFNNARPFVRISANQSLDEFAIRQ